MRTTFIFLIIFYSSVLNSQTVSSHIKRFWFGLYGPVYHSDTGLEVKMFKDQRTLTAILAAGVDYYVTYEKNDIYYIKLLNPIKIDITNDTIVKISVKEFIDNRKNECKQLQKEKYRLEKAQLKSGKLHVNTTDSLYDMKQGVAGMSYSRKEYIEINCSDYYYDTIQMRREQTLFYIQAPEPYEKIFRQGITTGTLILPIKIRPAVHYEGTDYERNFATDVSIGPYIGYKYNIGRRYDQYISGGLFAGPSLIHLNQSNSKKDNESESNVLGFTWGIGFTFEINKFQIGLVSGYDYLSGESAGNWFYDKKPWFSVGLGFQFFKQN